MILYLQETISVWMTKSYEMYVYDGMTKVSSLAERFSTNCQWKKLTVSAIMNISNPIEMRGGNTMKKIGVMMGSDSDLPVVRKAINTLAEFEVPYEVHIYSAHRTPEQAHEFAANARENGFGAIICAAGMAAHLAGVIAANTTLPVIGIPMRSGALDGVDALYSTVMMPSGIPVATVAIDGAVNAALLAIEMLAITDDGLAAKLKARRDADTAKVLEKNAAAEAEFNN